MTHRMLVVFTDDEYNRKYSKCFDNFLRYTLTLTLEYSQNWHTVIEREYNGRNVPNTNYIEFDNEEDAILFKLKFS